MRVVRLIHPVKIKIYQLDKTKSVINPITNTVTKTVYKDDPIQIIAQVNRGNNQTVSEFNTAFIFESSMYFLVYTRDVFAGNNLRVNVGDFVKEVIDLNYIFPVNVFIRSIEPSANYGVSYFCRLISESRDIQNPKKEDGSSVRAVGDNIVNPSGGMVFNP